MTDAVHKLEANLTPAQHSFLEEQGFKFADYFAYKNFGLIWKHPPALELARQVRALGLRASVHRGTVNVFYPTTLEAA